MQDNEVINILQSDLNFTQQSIYKLQFFSDSLLKANKKHNFIKF